MVGDCLERLKEIPDNSIDSVVTDPPYGLSFMGKSWDYDVPSEEIWKECLRVLKPGGHLLAFFGTRTYHRGAIRIEDAGFEIRDQIQWLYGSGFPKSHDISKAIDKAAGAERAREKCGGLGSAKSFADDKWTQENQGSRIVNTAITPEAIQWQGWGTALKPANEPIVVARKPLEKGLTAAQNVLKWGTGALNIDGSRIDSPDANLDQKQNSSKASLSGNWGKDGHSQSKYSPQGRWPSNVLLDEEAAKALDEQSIAGGIHSAGKARTKTVKSEYEATSYHTSKERQMNRYDDGNNIGASRFFYVAKASKYERNAGLEGMPLVESGIKNDSGRGFSESDPHKKVLNQNFHPTVKPIKLMSYLINMVTPPGGTVLDPFMGSGSTGVSAKAFGFGFIGIEREPQYFEICKKRIESVEPKETEIETQMEFEA